MPLESYLRIVFIPCRKILGMKILDMPKGSRPRERLGKYGAACLGDAELLALILQKGNGKENAIDLGNRLILQYGLAGLCGCTLNELKGIGGMGEAKSCALLAAFEIARRQERAMKESAPLNTPAEAFAYLCPKMSHLEQEHFVVLHIDSKNRVKKEETVFIGTLNCSAIHPREIYKAALKESSAAIIVAHNHPSGDPSPSDDDRRITRRLAGVGKLVGIPLLAHIVIGKGKFELLEGNG
ncbi:RadC-like JAB domain protein [Candidatus Anstonella stagnisolia]|nr:RadC-like JAB domain protein [Candidatus Anstonella stagnisolia]